MGVASENGTPRKSRYPGSLCVLLSLSVLTLAVTTSAFAGQSGSAASQTGQPPKESKSGYEDTSAIGGSTSVGRQLAQDDTVKDPVFSFNFLHDDFYQLKRGLKRATGIELNVDYNFLNQFASFSNDDRQASSGSLRFYGRWSPPTPSWRARNGLVFRVENRHMIGQSLTPRDLGFATGSALSTASFKEFGWGITSLYWAQEFANFPFAFVAGQMDPGDFEDLHPLLNAWTAFMNDASFNNPTTALPQQGLGLVGRFFISNHLYLKLGVNDANGTPTKIDFESFFKVREYFTWVEVGWSPEETREEVGDSVHVTAWHTDPRSELGVPEGWGITFSASRRYGERWFPFIRAGYSDGGAADGNGALLRGLFSIGAGIDVRRNDLLGIAVSWASPPLGEGPNQFTSEMFYRLQLTQNLEVTPGFHWTAKPAPNGSVWVGSVLRIRFTL